MLRVPWGIRNWKVKRSLGAFTLAKEKRGWTLNSAGYLLGPHAVDNHRSFNDKHGFTGKREIQPDKDIKADLSLPSDLYVTRGLPFHHGRIPPRFICCKVSLSGCFLRLNTSPMITSRDSIISEGILEDHRLMKISCAQ
ncbi:galanin peptides isoform X2 [Opisthocomus hoazin]|uniref:galanin peptides isoform X2 n=1 Tax=Opisthocomus hoazin TaxID=30419 RepID=UPI003F52CE9E